MLKSSVFGGTHVGQCNLHIENKLLGMLAPEASRTENREYQVASATIIILFLVYCFQDMMIWLHCAPENYPYCECLPGDVAC